MKFDFSGLSVQPASFDDVSLRYDIGLFCVGYERRARFSANFLYDKTEVICGLTYQNTRGLAFDENFEWARAHNAYFIDVTDYQVDPQSKYRNSLASALDKVDRNGRELRIWIDVSAMDRSLMARTLHYIFRCAKPPFRIRVCYAPARFNEPSYAFTPVRDCTPVIPELAGALGLPGREISLMVGLGYEYGVALGLIQQIEPDHVLAFVPKADDTRYDRAVEKANFGFDFGIDNPTLVRYRVDQPVSIFDKLFAITSNASNEKSVVIVPNGPKVFASIAVLIGIIRRPNVTILRTSQSSDLPSQHIEAAGNLIAYDVAANNFVP